MHTSQWDEDRDKFIVIYSFHLHTTQWDEDRDNKHKHISGPPSATGVGWTLKRKEKKMKESLSFYQPLYHGLLEYRGCIESGVVYWWRVSENPRSSRNANKTLRQCVILPCDKTLKSYFGKLGSAGNSGEWLLSQMCFLDSKNEKNVVISRQMRFTLSVRALPNRSNYRIVC